jgi:hypothetical protein
MRFKFIFPMIVALGVGAAVAQVPKPTGPGATPKPMDSVTRCTVIANSPDSGASGNQTSTCSSDPNSGETTSTCGNTTADASGHCYPSDETPTQPTPAATPTEPNIARLCRAARDAAIKRCSGATNKQQCIAAAQSRYATCMANGKSDTTPTPTPAPDNGTPTKPGKTIGKPIQRQ